MFRFGKQVESALLALKALDESNGLGSSTSEICSKHGLSKNTLSKIMQALHSAHIVCSQQGLNGGYFLQKPLFQISFFEVLNALGEIKKLSCSDNKACSLVENCSISSPLQNWEKKFEAYLKATNLNELLNGKTIETLNQNTNNIMEAACL